MVDMSIDQASSDDSEATAGEGIVLLPSLEFDVRTAEQRLLSLSLPAVAGMAEDDAAHYIRSIVDFEAIAMVSI